MSTRPQTLQRGPAPGRRASDTGTNVFTRKYGPLPGWAWFLIAVGGAYVVFRYEKGKKSGTSTTPSTTPTTLTTTPVTTSGGYSSGGSSGGGGGTGGYQRYTPTKLTTKLQVPPPTATTTGPKTVTGSTGPQTITIGGKKYRVLGALGPGGAATVGNLGYQVGGGAPVYFGNANTIKQGSTNEKAGEFAYTPTTYADLIYKNTYVAPGTSAAKPAATAAANPSGKFPANAQGSSR